MGSCGHFDERVWHSAVNDYGFITSRMLWVKFKFSKVKVCVVVVYGPLREKLWSDLNRVVDRIDKSISMCTGGSEWMGWR